MGGFFGCDCFVLGLKLSLESWSEPEGLKQLAPGTWTYLGEEKSAVS